MKIRIMDQEWVIEVVEPHSPSLYVEGGECCGATWNQASVIALSNELDGLQALRVIRHELAHAFIYTTQAVRPESYTEEDVAELIAIYAQQIVQLSNEVFEVLFKAK